MEVGFTFFAADRVRDPRLRLSGQIASKSRTNWDSWVVGKAVDRLMQRRRPAVRPSFNLLQAWGCRELDGAVLSNGMCNVQSQCWSCIKCDSKGQGAGTVEMVIISCMLYARCCKLWCLVALSAINQE